MKSPYFMTLVQPHARHTSFIPRISFFLVCRGHGTYLVDGKLLASVAGTVEKVNKLIYVQPPKSRYRDLKFTRLHTLVDCRYNGQVGDVVVGRIVEVCCQDHVTPPIPTPLFPWAHTLVE